MQVIEELNNNVMMLCDHKQYGPSQPLVINTSPLQNIDGQNGLGATIAGDNQAPLAVKPGSCSTTQGNLVPGTRKPMKPGKELAVAQSVSPLL